MPSFNESESSGELLALLGKKGDGMPAGWTGEQSLRLQMLVRSAKVSTAVARLKQRWSRQPHDDEGKKRLSDDTKKVIESIETEQQWLEDLPEDKCLDAAARTLSLTVVLTALGQAHTWLHHRNDAREALIRAMALSPNFIEPYITMALVLMDGKQQADPDWPARAEHMLNDALRIDPASRQALRLKAQLYGNPVFGKETDAIQILEKLDPDANVAFLLATLYDRVGRTKDAIQRMRIAILLGRNPEECYPLFVRYCLKLPANDPDKIALLEDDALRFARDLKDESLEKRVKEVLEKLFQAKKSVDQSSAETKPAT